MEDISNTKIRNKTYKKREKIINSIKGIPKLTKKQQDILLLKIKLKKYSRRIKLI